MRKLSTLRTLPHERWFLYLWLVDCILYRARSEYTVLPSFNVSLSRRTDSNTSTRLRPRHQHTHALVRNTTSECDNRVLGAQPSWQTCRSPDLVAAMVARTVVPCELAMRSNCAASSRCRSRLMSSPCSSSGTRLGSVSSSIVNLYSTSMQFAVEYFPGSFAKPTGYFTSSILRRSTGGEQIISSHRAVSRGGDGILVAAANVRHRFELFRRVPIPSVKPYECSHTEGLGRKETPERKAPSI